MAKHDTSVPYSSMQGQEAGRQVWHEQVVPVHQEGRQEAVLSPWHQLQELRCWLCIQAGLPLLPKPQALGKSLLGQEVRTFLLRSTLLRQAGLDGSSSSPGPTDNGTTQQTKLMGSGTDVCRYTAAPTALNFTLNSNFKSFLAYDFVLYFGTYFGTNVMQTC